MPFTQNLKDLAVSRESEIIVYSTSTMNVPFGAQIAPDTIPLFYKHLQAIGKPDKISLFLNSNGGSLEAPWPIVNLIREYCKTFEIIVPQRALSAATLIALGADKIVMTPQSQLSPIDPRGQYVSKKERIDVQVEDILGFIDFAKNKIGIVEQQALSDVMKELTKQIQPSILGSVNRTHSLIRSLSEKLLNLHNDKLQSVQIHKIVENLTEKLYSHKHLINRSEAKEIVGFEDIIEYASEEEEKLINDSFLELQKLMNLDEAFNPNKILGSNKSAEYKIVKALVKSSNNEDKFFSNFGIVKQDNADGTSSININILGEGWNIS